MSTKQAFVALLGQGCETGVPTGGLQTSVVGQEPKGGRSSGEGQPPVFQLPFLKGPFLPGSCFPLSSGHLYAGRQKPTFLFTSPMGWPEQAL